MAAAGADAFGVATLDEAVELRRSGIDQPIAVWIWDSTDEVAEALACRIHIGVPSPTHARCLVETGSRREGVHQGGDGPASLRRRRV